MSRPETSTWTPPAVVFEELLATVRRQGLAALIATHNPDLAARMDRTVTLREGRVVPA